MKRNYISTPTPATSSVTVTNNSKNATMWNDEDNDNGVDELLAMLGYKVKSTDMYDVAQKIEHLEGVFQNDDGLSQIASDSVHYNPSDLNSWLESMICELNPDPVTDPVSVHDNFVIDNDLQVIAGNAVYPPSKKLKPNFSSSSSSSSDSPSASASVSNTSSFHPNPNPNLNHIQNRSQISVSDASSFHPNPNLNQNLNQHENRKQIHNQNHQNQNQNNQVVIVDSQENGIRLVHTLMACAEAVQQNNYQLAENLVKQAGMLAVSQAGAMRKVATCFAEALARRIYRLSPESVDSPAFSDLLQMHFYETCPYLKFAHFTANQAILEAFAGKKKVHVIDFGLKQGMQWPALMQALALRPGGPPAFRLTGIGPPSGDNTDRLQEVGWKLAQLADTINVEFEFRGFIAGSLADLEPSMFDLRSDEVLAVNSVFELHQLLARSGAIEKVLSTVKMMKPEIVTVVEQEANHNGLNFLERFTESLHYYSTLFDSLESSGTGGVSGGGGGGGSGVGGSGVGGLAPVSDESKIMSEVYLGKQICNVVACEGTDRVERHETLTQWKTRFDSAGFEPVHLGSNAFKQASMLLALFAGGDGYRVEEDDGCLMLGWHTRPLIATSAWKIK